MAFNSKSVMKYLYLSKINDGSSNDLFCSSISVCLEISGLFFNFIQYHNQVILEIGNWHQLLCDAVRETT